MKIGIVCADERMRQVASNLAQDYDVYKIYEENDVVDVKLDMLVLPVRGIDEDGNIQMYDRILHLSDDFWIQQGCDLQVFSGTSEKGNAITPFWYCYMKDTKVVSQNAILTAEGVLNEMIQGTCKSIYSQQVDIIGYGTCGKAIYEMLKNLHVNVRVIRRQCDVKRNFMSVNDWKQCGDIIIHTAIGKMIDEQMVKQWKKTPYIIDIATPQLLPLEALKTHGCHVIKASNLPGKYAYISAGHIIADYIRRKIVDEK